jgi:hypothetical protein
MGNWVSDWFIAFLTTLLLSIACAGSLIVPWHDIDPEFSDGEITPAGKMLLRARLVFTAACGVIFVCMGLLYYFGFEGPYDWRPYRWYREHPSSLPIVLIIVSGTSGASCLLAQIGKGDGRRSLLIGALLIAVLSFCAALCLLST